MNDTVLISGASIAGPSLAYWLYLFKDEGRRQEFLASRFRRREILPRRRIAELRLEETRQALEPLMEVIAALGRLPTA
jgi:hypothetical protein